MNRQLRTSMQECSSCILVSLLCCDSAGLCGMAGFWPIKFCLWIFLLGITFVFPNSAMSGYGQFARVLAGIWLLVQMIILLDFIYDVNEWLLKKVSLCQRGIC